MFSELDLIHHNGIITLVDETNTFAEVFILRIHYTYIFSKYKYDNFLIVECLIQINPENQSGIIISVVKSLICLRYSKNSYFWLETYEIA